MDTEEEWRVIPGWGCYAISTRGRVWRILAPPGWKPLCHVGPIARITNSAWGHGVVRLSAEGRQLTFPLARLMLTVFVGPPPTEQHQAAHNNGNARDDRLENLRWASPEENARDRFCHGTSNRGTESGAARARLDPELVRQIRQCLAAGETKLGLSRRLGVARSTIRSVAVGRTWGYVE